MKHKKTAIMVMLCCALICGALTTAWADGLTDARSRGSLRVGVKTDFAPFGFQEPSGQIQGFDADLARYLGKALFEDETAIELVPVTSGSRIPLLYSNLIDVIIASMTITGDRQRVLDFSKPYFITGSLLLTLKESPIQGVRDLGGRRVAVVAGAVQEKDLPAIAPQARLVPFESLSDALHALRGTKVDALCQDDVALLNEAKMDANLRVAGPSFLPRPYAIAVRKGEAKFLAWIDARLEKMKSDGTLAQLRRKYFADMEAGLAPMK
ncbi:MAG: transporter substrate-binding domain-containing protein [Desulfobacterales bacterium]|nr:transporter substrate-binding domain-containing protein [Desulfobacterales bacterium]